MREEGPEESKKRRPLIARDHKMVGLGLRLYLERDPEIPGEVVGVAPAFTGTSGDFSHEVRSLGSVMEPASAVYLGS